MAISVQRTHYSHRRSGGHDQLEQRFRFTGVTAAAVSQLLMTAPLVGEESVFGGRPGVEVEGRAGSRRLSGFSPAPGFRFDVDLTERAGGFVVHFSQPDRAVPYLQGDLVWDISQDGDGVVFDEQINTAAALEAVDERLHGPRPSLRRWAFFRVGHKQVMRGAVTNMASLLDETAG